MKKVTICFAIAMYCTLCLTSCGGSEEEILPVKENTVTHITTDGGDGDGDESNKPCPTCQ